MECRLTGPPALNIWTSISPSQLSLVGVNTCSSQRIIPQQHQVFTAPHYRVYPRMADGF
ncbi:uncharacterized protein BDR25DRAFT_303511 [Lindgomyces ingoldianus]|uniref:Uncharacterized protein n=1 Tax=Lindgomyces ingoldianus TaxID=673940 RepID=A0ACB6QVA3_9PLEO|nr:uncharacterized protein BDR25DRAFT_303511 [Lindgomyces ingoldianus]KAF2470913.1 hypothetical protein BDR25DRAFT_303511 [Lindgomyces ingoldianus]